MSSDAWSWGRYVHHFIRATVKSKREPFACTHERITIDRKWNQAEQAELWCKPAEFAPSSAGSLSRRRRCCPVERRHE